MTDAVATIEHIRGETISFGLRSVDTPYDGTETVSCDVKLSLNGSRVPSNKVAPIVSIAPAFVGGAWLFTIEATQSEALEPARYITDAKVVYASGVVDYPKPLIINLSEHVTS